MENVEFNFWEIELWQILRMHADVKVVINFSGSLGVPSYYVTMSIPEVLPVITTGRTLWKRYRYLVKELQKIYGTNIHIYNAKPIKNENIN